MRLVRLLLLGTLLSSGACTGPAPAAVPRGAGALDTARLLADLRALAADSMEGRRTGTEGGRRAREYLLRAYREIGLQPAGGEGYRQAFTFVGRDSATQQGVNLLGLVPGTDHPERVLVVTAHYDHLGVRDGEIYNGADDNASGTAALLALARHFQRERPRHSILFAALDAEEVGLRGARALVAAPPVPRERLVLNVNMDMVGRSARGELFAAGTYHYPGLRPHLDRVAATAPVILRFGHDHPSLGPDDWTTQSDHGAFHAAGIPFVYFGVEDHPDYHRPTDDADRIDPAFFAGAVRTVLAAVAELDRHLAAIEPAATPRPGKR